MGPAPESSGDTAAAGAEPAPCPREEHPATAELREQGIEDEENPATASLTISSARLRELREKGLEDDLWKAQDGEAWPAVLSIFLHLCAISLAMPLYAEILIRSPFATGESFTGTQQLKRAQQILSVVLACNAVFEMLSSALLGVLCDRIGRFPVALLTQVGQIVDFGTAALCAGPGLQIEASDVAIIAARSVAGLCGNMKVPALAYIADVSTPKTSAANFGKAAAATGLALIAGPAIALVAVRVTGQIRVAFLAACVLNVLNLLVICTKWQRTKPDAQSVAPWAEANPITLMRTVIMRSRLLQIFGVMNFLDAFALYTLFASMPIFTKSKFGWGPQSLVPFILMIGIFVPIHVGITMRLLLKFTSEHTVLRVGYVASCVAFFLFFLVGLGKEGRLMYAVVFVLCFGFISNPMQTTLAVREVPRSDLGRLSGAYSILETGGKLAGPVVSAVVLPATMDGPLPSAVFLASSLVLVPGVVLAFVLKRFTSEIASAPSGAPTEARLANASGCTSEISGGPK